MTKRRAYQVHLVASLALVFGVEAGWKRWVGPAANGKLEMAAAFLGILAVLGALLLFVAPFREHRRAPAALIGAGLLGGAGTAVYFLVGRDDVDALHVLVRVAMIAAVLGVLGLIDRMDKP